MSRITKSVDLGFILSSIPQSDFKLDKFSDRLRLQKIIYSIQMFGVHLGYDFSWCIRGPYCTKLAKAGRELNVFYDEIPKDIEIGFRDDNDQKAFIRAKNFMKKLDKMLKKTDLDFTDKIEIAASIHNLYTDRKMMYDSIIIIVARSRFMDCASTDFLPMYINTAIAPVAIPSITDVTLKKSMFINH